MAGEITCYWFGQGFLLIAGELSPYVDVLSWFQGPSWVLMTRFFAPETLFFNWFGVWRDRHVGIKLIEVGSKSLSAV